MSCFFSEFRTGRVLLIDWRQQSGGLPCYSPFRWCNVTLGEARARMEGLDKRKLAVPEPFVKDIEKALDILKDEGCQEVYLFGSLSTGAGSDASDIDLGIRAYPRSKFFKIYGRLMMEIDHQFDLVDFEINESMFDVLRQVGEVQRIA
jgi:predicted nucleotidyltransferase